MVERLQELVELYLDPVRGLRAFDDGLHHCVGVLAELWIGQHLEKSAHAEHVAP
jgi:hypothetical protein